MNSHLFNFIAKIDPSLPKRIISTFCSITMCIYRRAIVKNIFIVWELCFCCRSMLHNFNSAGAKAEIFQKKYTDTVAGDALTPCVPGHHTMVLIMQENLGFILPYYSDVIMSAMASQITSLTIVYSTVYSSTDRIKHQSSASLAFVRGIHRGPVKSPHNGQ